MDLNNRGSVLIITVGAIFVFTLLGLSSVYVSSLQNQIAEKQRALSQAFWLADAGIEKARYYLRKTPPVLIDTADAPVNMGKGNYDVFSQQDPDCPTCVDRWFARSQGAVNTGAYTGSTQLTHQRAIESIVARYDIENAITAQGTVNDDCTPNGSATITGTCEQNTDFSFESIFNGTSSGDFLNQAQAANLYYLDPNNSGDIDPVEDVTWIDLIVKNKVNISTANMPLDLVADPSGNTVQAAFIIIDTTQCQSVQPPQVHIDGGLTFRGIIWIIGEAEIKGTSNINGAVFVDGNPVLDTKVTGDADITFDPVAVNEAVDTFSNSIFPGLPAIISWQEV